MVGHDKIIIKPREKFLHVFKIKGNAILGVPYLRTLWPGQRPHEG